MRGCGCVGVRPRPFPSSVNMTRRRTESLASSMKSRSSGTLHAYKHTKPRASRMGVERGAPSHAAKWMSVLWTHRVVVHLPHEALGSV